MVLPLEPTDVPGVYRRGSKFVVVYRVGGRQRKHSAERACNDGREDGRESSTAGVTGSAALTLASQAEAGLGRPACTEPLPRILRAVVYLIDGHDLGRR
jgi:hypothetical protein